MKFTLMDIRHSFTKSDGAKLPVISGINLSIEEGELVVMLGPSGSGKSTVLRIAAGLLRPEHGTAWLDGTHIDAPTRNVGMVFQDFSLFPWLTVYENIAFGLRVKGDSANLIDDAVESYVSLVGLSGFQQSYPRELSAGMKQRVAIARALAVKPSLLLMDEPFASLDVKTSWEMQDLVLEVRRATNMTILFVTHNVEEGVFLGDRLLLLSPRPAEIRQEIRTPFQSERPESIKNSDEFLVLEARITKLLRQDVSK